jgi:hypothetical protein
LVLDEPFRFALSFSLLPVLVLAATCHYVAKLIPPEDFQDRMEEAIKKVVILRLKEQLKTTIFPEVCEYARALIGRRVVFACTNASFALSRRIEKTDLGSIDIRMSIGLLPIPTLYRATAVLLTMERDCIY